MVRVLQNDECKILVTVDQGGIRRKSFEVKKIREMGAVTGEGSGGSVEEVCLLYSFKMVSTIACLYSNENEPVCVRREKCACLRQTRLAADTVRGACAGRVASGSHQGSISCNVIES